MAISKIFKDLAAVLVDYVGGDTYRLLDMTSKVESIVNSEIARVSQEKTNLWTREVERAERDAAQARSDANLARDQATSFENQLTRANDALFIALVPMVLANPTIMGFLVKNQKMSAIKELRQITGAGLRVAKNAVEAGVVQDGVRDRQRAEEPLAEWELELLSGRKGRDSMPEAERCSQRTCNICYEDC